MQEREKFITTLRVGLNVSMEQHSHILSKLEHDSGVARLRCGAGCRERAARVHSASACQP